MKTGILRRIITIACAMIITLCMLTQGVFAAEIDEQAVWNQQEAAGPEETEPEETEPEETEPGEDDNRGILEEIKSLPERIAAGIINAIEENVDTISAAALTSSTEWLFQILLTVAETVFSAITSTTSNVFNYQWFKVIVDLFSKFGMLLFAIGVALALVDVGIEYRRRGADLGGTMLNLGKGLMVVGLFSTVPVPLFNFCVNAQSVILHTLSINWSFQSIIDALMINFSQQLIMVVMLVIMIVLMILVYLDTLKRGGILLVLICVGSLHMISVPRGYMDNFYSWCKQVIALCITVLFQNLLMFCGFMIVPSNLFLGIGVMCAAKEVPLVCAQFGLDTSVKASFSRVAMGANASIQAVKAASSLFA